MSGVGDFSSTAAPGRPLLVRQPNGDDDRELGRSLAAILAVSGPMPAERVARLIDSIALGLQVAHRQGVAHGRLTPERILVLPPRPDDEAGAVRTKILEFALPGDADPEGDQFALGAIAYEMLAGVQPFLGGPWPRRAPPSLRHYAPDVNVLVDEVIGRALSPDPDVRWADVYTFSTRLREAIDGLDAFEEPTRLAPIPLTVSRPAAMPAPSDVDADFPVVASVDVDLRTPSPQPNASPIGGPTMNQSHYQPPRGPGPSRQYPIQPTPTFSFTEGPEPSPLWTPADRPRRRRSGGGFRLLVLMIAAGVGGYAAVRYRAWPELGPVVERGKDFVRSLRSLAPAAAPDPAAAAPAPVATTPVVAPVAAPAPAPAAAALRPEVVPIVSPTAAAPKPRPLSPGRAHVSRSHRHKPAKVLKPLSDEAAAEEALLAAPPR
jgi:serine/threonine-protein kinase